MLYMGLNTDNSYTCTPDSRTYIKLDSPSLLFLIPKLFRHSNNLHLNVSFKWLVSERVQHFDHFTFLKVLFFITYHAHVDANKLLLTKDVCCILYSLLYYKRHAHFQI